jgi:tetratricopeptide (TPR) repeat protein
MKRFTLALLTLVCLLLVAPLANAAVGKDQWTSVRSKNFFLIGNASEKDIRKVANKMEQFREVFTRLFPNAKFTSPVPTTVIVFKSDSSFKPFKPLANGKASEVAGYFQPGPDVNYITLTTEMRSTTSYPYRTIFHEYVHLLVNNTMGKTSVPPWFNEGLAEYYSTFEIEEDQKVYLGKPIGHHLQLLRDKGLIPLKTLFSVQYPLHGNKREDKAQFYAQSWALMHYLIISNDGQRQPQMGQFLNLLAAGRPVEDAFREAFKTDYATMEKELKEYVRRETFGAAKATFERKLQFEAEMQAALISEAQASAYLGDLLLHTHRFAEAESHIQQALALEGELAMAHASLGMLRMRQDRFAEAKRHLQRAINATGTQSYLAHYYYAFVLSREGMATSGQVLEYDAEKAKEMRAQLRKAIELKPDFTPSYNLYAFINLVTGEQLDEAVTMLKQALTHSAGSQEAAYYLAQVYLRKQDIDAARKLAEPLAENADDEQTRAGAQSLLQHIKSIQEQKARWEARNDKADAQGESATGSPRLNKRSDSNARTDGNSPVNEIVTAAPAYDPSAALNEALRKPLAGEVRTQGTLVRIDCNAKGIIYTIKIGERVLLLHSASFENVDLSAYTTDAGSEMGCGPRKTETPIVVTYRPAKDARAKWEGGVTAIEFVPKDFKLKQ